MHCLRIAGLVLALFLAAASPAAAKDYRHLMPQPPHVWAHHSLNPECGEGKQRADGTYAPGDRKPCADPSTGEIWIGKRPFKFTVSHELGHLWWAQVATEADRQWFKSQLRFAPAAPWEPSFEDYERGTFTPAEFAADAYAACDLGMTTRPQRVMRNGKVSLVYEWIDAYGYVPSPRVHDRVCAYIKRAGLRFEVNAEVERVAQTTDRINDSIVGWHALPCVQQGQRRWLCPVSFALSDGSSVTVTYTVGPELTRKRRNGHWVGPWKRTGRVGVTGVSAPV